MYSEFVEWVEETKPRSNVNPYYDILPAERVQKICEDALIFFKKKEEYDNLRKARLNKNLVKGAFSGHRIRDWTDLGEYWKGVKIIMDEVRVRMGGDNAIAEFLMKNSEDDLKAIVLKAQADLGIRRREQFVEDATQTLAKTLEATSV